MKKLYILILVLIPFLGSAQKVYVDAGNTTGIEDGTIQHPFKTIEEGITESKTGDTIFVKNGNYSPLGGELYLKPGTILFGENPENTIINADIRDSTRNELPFEIHNLTFKKFYCSRGTNFTEFYTKPCIIKNNICQYISLGHAGGYTENGELLTFYPIPFFHIENNTVSGEITFNHGAGKIVGRNIIRNNTAETISLNMLHSWQQVLNAEHYHFQLAAENDFANLISDADSLNSCFFASDGLAELSEYFWRVKAVNLAGQSDWSETWSFKTGNATSANLEKSNIEFINAWPNPFTENVTISYSVKFPGFVSLKIYNVPGNEIANLVNQVQLQGKYNLQFNGSRLKPGLYFCILTTGESSQTIKIILSEP